MSKELALNLIKLLSALEVIGIIDGKTPDYLQDNISSAIEQLHDIVMDKDGEE